MSLNNEVCDELVSMMLRARVEGLWFYSSYQDIWWSPDEMLRDWEAGRYRWGALNFALRSPLELLTELTGKSIEINTQTQRVLARMNAKENAKENA